MARDTLPRVAAQFAIARIALIHILASGKEPMPTQDIADKLGVNRSYVIRLQGMSLKPRTDSERAIVKLAKLHEAALRKMGFGYLFHGDIETTLAGGDRMHLPRESRGGRPRNDAPKAKPKAPAKKAAPAKPKAPAKVAKTKAPAKVAKTKAPAKVAKTKAPAKKAPPSKHVDRTSARAAKAGGEKKVTAAPAAPKVPPPPPLPNGGSVPPVE